MSVRSRAAHLGNFDDRPWGISAIAIITRVAIDWDDLQDAGEGLHPESGISAA